MLDNTKDSYKVKPIHVNDFTKILKIKVVFTFKEKNVVSSLFHHILKDVNYFSCSCKYSGEDNNCGCALCFETFEVGMKFTVHVANPLSEVYFVVLLSLVWLLFFFCTFTWLV